LRLLYRQKGVDTIELLSICTKHGYDKEPIYKKAHELKIIVFNKHDFIWAQEEAAKVSADCKLYLQPEWSKRNEIVPLIVEFVKENPRWQVSLQTHKYMNIP